MAMQGLPSLTSDGIGIQSLLGRYLPIPPCMRSSIWKANLVAVTIYTFGDRKELKERSVRSGHWRAQKAPRSAFCDSEN